MIKENDIVIIRDNEWTNVSSILQYEEGKEISFLARIRVRLIVPTTMSYKAMYKNELARAAGVSSRTFARWLHHPSIRQRLEKYHISPRQQMLPPNVVRLICEHFDIDI